MMKFLLFFFLVCRCNKNNAMCCNGDEEEPICSCSLQENSEEQAYACSDQEASNPSAQTVENCQADSASNVPYRKSC
jgi:hypothetical protein